MAPSTAYQRLAHGIRVSFFEGSEPKGQVKPEEPDGHLNLDLQLLCANGGSIVVSSKLLRDATRNLAVKDIIDRLAASNTNPMELPVPDDDVAVWRVAWGIIVGHPTVRCKDLEWGNIEQVIQLADKIDLPCVLQACELLIATVNAKKPTVASIPTDNYPFGYLHVDGAQFRLTLDFLELLFKVKMWSAPVVLAPHYTAVLHAYCTELKDKRKVFTDMLLQVMANIPPQPATLTYLERRRADEATLSDEVTELSQQMHTDLSAYLRSAGDSEAAARVVGLIHEQMALALAELAVSSLKRQ